LRLTDPLEFRDAILTWIHILIYTLHATMKSPHGTHGITPITSSESCFSYNNHHLYLIITFSCLLSTTQHNFIHYSCYHTNLVHITHTTHANTPKSCIFKINSHTLSQTSKHTRAHYI